MAAAWPAQLPTVRQLFLCAAFALAGCSLDLPPSVSRFAAEPVPIDASTDGSGHFRVLHSFGGSGLDGGYPSAPLLVVSSKFYGTTSGGGTSNLGTVFSMNPQGRVTVLHSFGGAGDGAYPTAGVVDIDGVLYGTTSGSGDDYGTVFAITPQGEEKTLYAFRGAGDGAGPIGGLIAVDGELYGTTARGGKNDNGTVFRLTLQGKKQVLHYFTPRDGDQPWAPLIDVRGGLFGSTTYGGKYGNGTAFRVDAAKRFKVLHDFGAPGDVGSPSSGFIFVNGLLYGTTAFGPVSGSNGAVFSLTLDGQVRILHRFQNQWGGGYNAIGAVVWSGGLFHGTTAGAPPSGPPGTLYRLSPNGTFQTLHVFAHRPGGEYPDTAVTPFDGSFYGTTLLGGYWNEGTTFVYRP